MTKQLFRLRSQQNGEVFVTSVPNGTRVPESVNSLVRNLQITACLFKIIFVIGQFT